MRTITEIKESNFDTVFDSQKVFRILMNAFSFPGKIYKLPEINLSGINNEYSPVVIPLLTLMDFETSFSVVGDYENIEESEKIIKCLEINTGAKYENINRADYCISLNKFSIENFKLLKKGKLESPDKSSMLFYMINKISDIDLNDPTIILTGPGIENEITLSINGLSTIEIKEWIEDRMNYPLGIDIFLIDKNLKIAGLPRSTKIRIKEEKLWDM